MGSYRSFLCLYVVLYVPIDLPALVDVSIDVSISGLIAMYFGFILFACHIYGYVTFMF